MNKIACLLIVLGCFMQTGAFASNTVSGANEKPEADARIHRLESNFRCLVCQNETIADSTADLAADLRAIIHEQVERGATDAQIRDYMVTRYGDFVLYDPPFKQLTWALWIGPFALLVLGFVALFLAVLRRRNATMPPLSDFERRRARRLLGSRS